MVQGADRPTRPTGQPNIGQGSIFGNGGPSFAQMPSFTPVTRGGAEPAAPNGQIGAGAQGQNPAPPAQPTYQPAPALHPQAAHPQAAQPQPYGGAPVAQQQAIPPQQPAPAQQMAPAQPALQPQAYAAQNPAQNAHAPSPVQSAVPDLSAADSEFPDTIFGDLPVGSHFDEQPMGAAVDANASFPDTPGIGAPEQGAHNALYQAPLAGAEAPFQSAFGGAAGQPQPNVSQPQAYGGQQPMPAAQHPAAYGQDPAAYGQDPAAYGQDPAAYGQDPAAYGQDPAAYAHSAAHEQVPQADPSRQLQAFDPGYGGQPSQVPLGDPHAGMHPSGNPFDTVGGDADFMDESHAAAEAGIKSKMMSSMKGRSAVMVVSALLGAIALGGALAYAYQQSGGAIGSGDAPIITADASPIKEAPNQPGGKEFPHKNKLIYDRLTNGATPQSERLVPRQEDVAVPALPAGAATAGLPAAVATTDLTNPAAGEDGGPRKVKTMVVRPDGSVETPPPAAASPAASMMAQPNMMPVPALGQPGAPQQVAAVAPAAAAAAVPAAAGSFVVQLGSSKSQTDALANFADAQQKYPSLLSKYQPLVRKTNLGAKGTWYRLQVGPMADKTAAYKLCGQLKAKGHGDCLVMAQ